jgi:hypothetical protein
VYAPVGFHSVHRWPPFHTRIAVAGRASAISRKRDFGARAPLVGFVGFVGFAFELIQCRSRDA